jgi:hypothetical protein
VEKILLLHHSALGVPINWHTCLLSSPAGSTTYTDTAASPGPCGSRRCSPPLAGTHPWGQCHAWWPHLRHRRHTVFKVQFFAMWSAGSRQLKQTLARSGGRSSRITNADSSADYPRRCDVKQMVYISIIGPIDLPDLCFFIKQTNFFVKHMWLFRIPFCFSRF